MNGNEIKARFRDVTGDVIPIDKLFLPTRLELRPMKGDILSSKDGKKYEIALCEIVVTDGPEWIDYTLKEITSGNNAQQITN